jgi:hypothetical protein
VTGIVDGATAPGVVQAVASSPAHKQAMTVLQARIQVEGSQIREVTRFIGRS